MSDFGKTKFCFIIKQNKYPVRNYSNFYSSLSKSSIMYFARLPDIALNYLDLKMKAFLQ